MSRWMTVLAKLEAQRVEDEWKELEGPRPYPTDHQLTLLVRVLASMGGYEPVNLNWNDITLTLTFLVPWLVEVEIGQGIYEHCIRLQSRRGAALDETSSHHKTTTAGERAFLARLLERFEP